MFKGFKKKLIKVKKGKIFCRIGGKDPPLLLLHGYPQTHFIWHKTANELSKYFTIIAADLRGYGSSFVLKSDNKHFNYSKRVNMYKYTLVEQDEKIEKFHKERIEAFDNLEARLDNVKKLLRQGKIETIKHYRNNPNDFSVIIGTDLIGDYFNDIETLLKND